MNGAPDVNLWIELLVVTGLGTALIAGSAALLCRFVRAATGRRAVWQASTVCLAALVLGELTGSAPLFARLLSFSPAGEATGAVESASEREGSPAE